MDTTPRALNKLRPLMKRLRQAELKAHDPWILCVRSSLSKAFDFAIFAYGPMRGTFAFHCMGGLRSIAEDIIVLSGLMALRRGDRNKVFRSLTAVELDKRIKAQAQFISEFHAGQPVLNRRTKTAALTKASLVMKAVWKGYGYTLASHDDRPSTRQIARKLGSEPLEVLYDFMFRVTSGTVHFSTLSLLGLGWGPSPTCITLSPRNYGRYYLAFCRIYSVFLLTCYFELFHKYLRLTKQERGLIETLRINLVREPIWPEMVTFEQANQKRPETHPIGVMMYIVLSDHYSKGFIRAYKRKMSRSLQRSARGALRLFAKTMKDPENKNKSLAEALRATAAREDERRKGGLR